MEFSVGSGNVLLAVITVGIASGSDLTLLNLRPSVADGVNEGWAIHGGELLSPVQNPLAITVTVEHSGDAGTHSSNVLNIEIRLILVALVRETVRSVSGNVALDVEVRVELSEGIEGEEIREGSNSLYNSTSSDCGRWDIVE